nr:MAG TPA: hypothetical protein [Caudoviricetes sp.]
MQNYVENIVENCKRTIFPCVFSVLQLPNVLFVVTKCPVLQLPNVLLSVTKCPVYRYQMSCLTFPYFNYIKIVK